MIARMLKNPFFRYGALIVTAMFLVALVSPGFFGNLFRADEFMPHATCYLRNPRVILLHVTSDLVIGFSYVAISIVLAYIIYKGSRNLPFHSMFLAFGLFIITCGLTHLMEVWTVWQAVYWLAGYVKAITAAASLTTAIALIWLRPRILAFIEAAKLSELRRKELEFANKELNAFAYSVSHDLRAPLRAVQGMSSALKEDFADKMEPEAKAYLERIIGASSRMDALIHDLLEYSRVSRAELEMMPVRLDEALREAEHSICAAVQERRVEVKYSVDDLSVVASKTLLIQVLANLLGNAVKFVPADRKPDVSVTAQREGENVVIRVRDNGIGIEPQYQEKIFHIFERLHSASEYAGTGIGLAIVQKAVLRMKGRIGLESEVGKGTTFWVELPAGPVKPVR